MKSFILLFMLGSLFGCELFLNDDPNHDFTTYAHGTWAAYPWENDPGFWQTDPDFDGPVHADIYIFEVAGYESPMTVTWLSTWMSSSCRRTGVSVERNQLTAT